MASNKKKTAKIAKVAGNDNSVNITKQRKERYYSDVAKRWISIFLVFAVAIVFLSIGLSIYLSIVKTYTNLFIYVIPTIFLIILGYIVNMYVRRIDDTKDRLTFLEGKIKAYENANEIGEIFKRK